MLQFSRMCEFRFTIDETSLSSGLQDGPFPPPPQYVTRHCPPLPLGYTGFGSACNCVVRHNQFVCCVMAGGICKDYLDSQLQDALHMADSRRLPNNLQRKKCYQRVARILNYTARRPLPDCAVMQIRMIYPGSSG